MSVTEEPEGKRRIVGVTTSRGLMRGLCKQTRRCGRAETQGWESVEERGRDCVRVQGRGQIKGRTGEVMGDRDDDLGMGDFNMSAKRGWCGLLGNCGRIWKRGMARTWLSRNGCTRDWAAPAARHASRSYEPTGSNE